MITKSQQKGYISAMKYYNNIPKSIKAIQDYRVKVLEHKNQYGIESAIDAFGVGRSTIYLWQKKYCYPKSSFMKKDNIKIYN